MTTTNTTNPYPGIPLPAGAVHVDDWYDVDTPEPARYFRGSSWSIQRTDGLADYFCVQVDGTQRHDGTVTRQVVIDDINITAEQALDLALALVEAAHELDQWAGSGSLGTRSPQPASE
jgi:hypothetical protein